MSLPRRYGEPGFCDDDRRAWAELSCGESARTLATKAGVSVSAFPAWRARFGVAHPGRPPRRRMAGARAALAALDE